MAEQSWHEARLIPTSGINGADEQERRATSALLAVLSAVREFNRALLKPLGAPAGAVECFIEVPFVLGDKKVFPDGLIRVSRGAKSWTALVEVKTGSNDLATEQLENYLDVAREQGFDAVLTISNEIPAVAGQHPTKVDRRKLKKVALHHLSWSKVLAEAVMQKEFRGVADPDQAWILGELIRYLEHTRSGALEFNDMGDSWTAVRDSVAAGTLRATDKGIPTVVARFDALMRFTSLSLGRRLGTEVVPVLTRKELADPSLRAGCADPAAGGDRPAVGHDPHPRHRRAPGHHRRPARRTGHLPRRRRRPARRTTDHPRQLAGPAAEERPRRCAGRVHDRPLARLVQRRAAGHRAREPRVADQRPCPRDPLLPGRPQHITRRQTRPRPRSIHRLRPRAV